MKEPTVPEGFELEIEKRLQERQVHKKPQDGEKPNSFKAKPLPKKVLDGVVVSPIHSFIQSLILFNISMMASCCPRVGTKLDVLLLAGLTREESHVSNCTRIPCIRPEEQSSYGTQS